MKPKTFTLKNKNGMTLKASEFGCTVVELTAPDRDGRFENIVLSYDDIGDYRKNGYANSIIGRVAGRISDSSFVLDGKRYKLSNNDGAHSLHGGKEGFESKLWATRQFASPDGPALEFTYLSPDGEEGYPGNLFVRCVYTLTEWNAWRIQYWAMTDAPTVINLTNHAYFNLAAGKRDVLDHRLFVGAELFPPTNKALIPTGEIIPVEDTPLDFRAHGGKRLGDVIGKVKSPYLFLGGFDNSYVFNDDAATDIAPCAVLHDPESGRTMYCTTTEPSIQLYTANNMTAGIKGAKGAVYGKHYGVCFETQHIPDSPNQAGFKSVRLNPGDVFKSETTYTFSSEG